MLIVELASKQVRVNSVW